MCLFTSNVSWTKVSPKKSPFSKKKKRDPKTNPTRESSPFFRFSKQPPNRGVVQDSFVSSREYRQVRRLDLTDKHSTSSENKRDSIFLHQPNKQRGNQPK